MRLFDHSSADNGSVLKHILEVNKIAVVHMLRKIIRIMEMDQALLMSLGNIIGYKETTGDILADLACHVVALNADNRGILVGIFLLYLFIIALNKREYLLIGGVGLTNELTGITIGNIMTRNLESALIHDLILDNILNLFHAEGTVHICHRYLNILRNTAYLKVCHPFTGNDGIIRLCYRGNDLLAVKFYFRTTTLDDLHVKNTLL